MELPAINSPTAALIAGLITSLHCVGMCGPLACGLMPVRGDRADAQTVSTIYHVTDRKSVV
jgi:sulfite exporter TauE/SafE